MRSLNQIKNNNAISINHPKEVKMMKVKTNIKAGPASVQW